MYGWMDESNGHEEKHDLVSEHRPSASYIDLHKIFVTDTAGNPENDEDDARTAHRSCSSPSFAQITSIIFILL